MSDLLKRTDDPEKIAEAGIVVSDEDWTEIPNNIFFHTCCDCGLSHFVEIKHKRIRFERLDNLTEIHKGRIENERTY